MLFALALMLCFCLDARADQIQAPEAPPEVAAAVEEKADSFSQGLWNVTKEALKALDPALAQGAGVCLKAGAVVLLSAFAAGFAPKEVGKAMELAGAVAMGCVLLEPSRGMIELGTATVSGISEYGKLLLPVMTTALACQGGGTSSAGLYAATALFDSILSTGISRLLIPVLWMYIALSVAAAAVGEPMLGKIRDICKGTLTWGIKTSLYLFTGFLTVTGVISGSADAAALKAAKLTISGAVPVVGGILSDASEAVLVGAGVMRSAAGVYGMLTIIALFLSPFIRIGVQYLMLKLAAALCSAFGKSGAVGLMGDFSAAMGLVLAMTAAQCVLFLVSTVCFMKGVG